MLHSLELQTRVSQLIHWYLMWDKHKPRIKIKCWRSILQRVMRQNGWPQRFSAIDFRHCINTSRKDTEQLQNFSKADRIFVDANHETAIWFDLAYSYLEQNRWVWGWWKLEQKPPSSFIKVSRNNMNILPISYFCLDRRAGQPYKSNVIDQVSGLVQTVSSLLIALSKWILVSRGCFFTHRLFSLMSSKFHQIFKKILICKDGLYSIQWQLFAWGICRRSFLASSFTSWLCDPLNIPSSFSPVATAHEFPFSP